jgi:hypothetical protein
LYAANEPPAKGSIAEPAAMKSGIWATMSPRPMTPRSAGVNIGVESYDDARCIDRQYRRGNLARLHQIVAAAADVDRASQLAEEAPLRLPRDSIGEATLYLQTFVAQHPGVDRREDFARSSGNGPRRGREPRACDLRHDAAFLGHVDARSFLGERLIERPGAETDLVSYVEELSLADQIARLGKRARALQLRGPREDAL